MRPTLKPDPQVPIIYMPTYEQLMATEERATGLSKGRKLRTGAMAIDTGRFTGRSPKDKYIVRREDNADTVWWAEDGSDNQPMADETFLHLRDKVVLAHLCKEKRLYVVDGYCGADPEDRLYVRLVTPIAWQAHFFKNMFITPTSTQAEADWTTWVSSATTCPDYRSLGLRSEVFFAADFKRKQSIIAGTWYTGEIKKGMFTVMNYLLPLCGVGAFHCSANVGEEGTALFFGLSGTGKTTLSTDSKRAIVGDDEHGWNTRGIFNLEGGCYAKLANLSEKTEPEIYGALRTPSLVENVKIVGDWIDFKDLTKTENTRASYPLCNLKNRTEKARAEAPKAVIFLTCDAYGLLPPVSILNQKQAIYYFLLGYTAKVAGTELGITEPEPTFSTCFAKPFLPLRPQVYADLFAKKIREAGASVFFVNTGWTGGGYGTGKRISIEKTRRIIWSILDGSIGRSQTTVEPHFGLRIPTSLPGVPEELLRPWLSWKDPKAYEAAAKTLCAEFEKVRGPLIREKTTTS